VRNYDSILSALKGVNYVFHAAALKQVPSCEFYPMEAVRTNVIGTENLLNAAIAQQVEKVICLSTDKAVYPINAMGISKALMEKIMVAKSRDSDKTILVGTRYGNVMASRGSVIPLFVEQIHHNLPITITDPAMTRFMMTLDEAVNLVLYAFQHGNSGDIFVQKSPAATIGMLAETLRKIYHSEVDVKIIGTRHAEKLFETLLTREEMQTAEDMGNYYRIPSDNRDLNYSKYFFEGSEVAKPLADYDSHNTTQLSEQELISLLKSIGYPQF
jgi:UDP-glucose 4-epimerase